MVNEVVYIYIYKSSVSALKVMRHRRGCNFHANWSASFQLKKMSKTYDTINYDDDDEEDVPLTDETEVDRTLVMTTRFI